MHFFDFITRVCSENILYVGIFIILVVFSGSAAYWLQKRHTTRGIDAIAMQERHLYRALAEQMQAAEQLRMVNHDAKNELFVLQGFLERGETAQALAYVADLTDREPLDGD